MRDIFRVFLDFKGGSNHHGKTNYNLVNTHDIPRSNPYHTTTTSNVNGNAKKSNPKSESLSAVIVLNRILFKGKLSQEENRTKCVLFTMFVGLVAISLGTLLLVFSPYEIIFAMKTTFAEGAEGFEMWRVPPVDVFLKVYLYNITNKEEFLEGKEKLKVEEVGPYIYREVSEHADIKFNHENGTVTATPKYPLEWVPELNINSEDDVLVLPNVALLSFANVMASQPYVYRTAINLLITQTDTQPIVEQTAKEFMFGYQSTLVTLGNSLMPNWIYFDKLGLIDRMYDFNGDISTTYTGETNQHLSGILATYNRLETLPQWKAPCNKLNGSSDGTKFPTMIKSDEPLSFFRKSLCRSMPMIRSGITDTANGIPTVHYRFKDDALDNGDSNPENKCFCTSDKCLPNGLIDVTHCYYGFPIALSYPHFYKADPKLRENIEGAKPNQDLHETYFYINPDTGTPTKVSVKMQINIALGDVQSVNRCGRFSNLVVPLLWTDITMPELSRIVIVKLFLLLRILPVVETLTLYLLLICGVAFILLSLCALIFISYAKENTNIQQPKSQKQSKKPLVKNINADYKTQEKYYTSNNKEMDVYFCSLLTPNSDNEEVLP